MRRQPEYAEKHRELVMDIWWPTVRQYPESLLVIERALSRIWLCRRESKLGGLFGLGREWQGFDDDGMRDTGRFRAMAESAANAFVLTTIIPQPDLWNQYAALDDMLNGQASIHDSATNAFVALQMWVLSHNPDWSHLADFLEPPHAYPFTTRTRFSRLRRRYYESVAG